MPVRIVVGVNWGDEGKGRSVNYFAKDADYVIRFQGGNNAGHTIENEFGNFSSSPVSTLGLWIADEIS